MKDDVKSQEDLPVRSKYAHPVKRNGLWIDFDKRVIDGRTKLGKYLNLLRASLTRDLGGDLSTQQAILVDRVVHKTIKCFLYERGILDGDGQGSRDHYLACTNSLRLDLCALGLERRTQDLTERLEDYLKNKEVGSNTSSL